MNHRFQTAPLWMLLLLLPALAHAEAPITIDAPRAYCSAPYEGTPLRAAKALASHDEWSGVASSRTTPGVIAVWSETRVAVSRDDGRTFHMLRSSFKHIEDVEVGSGGTVFVLDGRSISMEFARGGLRTVQVPSYAEERDEDGLTSLAVGAGYLVHVSSDGLAFTHDYGATWHIKELPGGPDRVELTVADDASLLAVLTFYNCHSGDSSEVYRGSVEGEWTQVEVVDDWRPDDFNYEDMSPFNTVDNGRRSFGRFGKRLYRTQPGKPVLLTESVPEAFWLYSADACNRVLGLWNDRLVRWSPAAGWHQLDVRGD